MMMMFEDFFQSSTSASLLVATVGLLVMHFLYSTFKEKRLEPPGPRSLPLLGNLHQLDLKGLHNSFTDLSKKYGSVFTVNFGIKKMVVLAGYKTVKQALVNHAEEFGERDINPSFSDFNSGHGILFANGESWKEMRRFAVSTLKDLGMGKNTTEERIIEECQYVIEDIQKHEGKPFEDTMLLCYASSNIISMFVFGKRFDYKDPVFRAMVERDRESIRVGGSPSMMLYNVFPWLRPFIKNWDSLLHNKLKNTEELSKIIAELKEDLNPEMCRCFVESFLIRQLNLEESEIKDSYYHDDNLLCCTINLFGAGTDTTSSTLQWSLLLMAKYPDVQDKVQEELSKVVGSRQVRYEDRKNLPYTEAVIHEIQRLANIVPLGVVHRTTRDVTFQGYFIKEGTTIVPFLQSVLHDESEWETPHTFNPSHFLDKDGKFVKRNAFMPFSAGRRMCIGETLARMELLLFFGTLLQRFRFTPPPGVTEAELDLTPVVGLTLTAKPHKLCAIPRH